jgi:hypothetical protein
MGAAAALPAVATTAATTAPLAAGVTAGSLLGTGAASTGLLGSLGLNALGGMTSVLPAAATTGSSLALPALATKGLTAAASPGIFANAAPALGGLKSLAGPGLLQTGGMSPLGGMASVLPAGTSIPGAAGASQLAGASNLAGQAGNISNQMYNQLVNQFARPDLGQGFTQLGPKLAGPEAASSLAPQTTQLAENIRAFKTATEGPASMSYAQGAQGISPNVAPLPPGSPIIKGQNFLSNLGNLIQNPSVDATVDYAKEHPIPTAAAAGLAAKSLLGGKSKPPEEDLGSIRPYKFRRTELEDTREPGSTAQRQYFRSEFIPEEPYSATSPKAKEIEKIAGGGITAAYAIGGPVEMMAAQNAVGANTGYPMAGINTAMYSNPMVQRPEAVNVISPSGDAGVAAYSGEPKFARGGLSDLGDYSDGGRLLKGPGDGVSDSIPAVIGKRQPARLADGEFVIPARIVSELGNGSTEAGARKLYAMMERIQATRKKSIGKKKVAVNSKADKHLPA